MFKELLTEKHQSLYSLARECDIPYTTLRDLVTEKTSIEHVSAGVLYRLSKALDMTMEQLYLYRESRPVLYLYHHGRQVMVSIQGKTLTYMGPKNLIGFKRINQNRANCLYVETFFLDDSGKIYTEEDYIDLNELFMENNCEDLLSVPYEIILGQPTESKTSLLAHNALLVSDYLVVNFVDTSTEELCVEISNIKRNNDRMLMRLTDYAVLSGNMSQTMTKRAISMVKRNRDFIEDEIKEMRQHA